MPGTGPLPNLSIMSNIENYLSSNTKGRAKHWVFTLNNPTEADLLKLRSYFPGVLTEEQSLQVRPTYLIYGHEVAPSSGTPHLQGFVSLSERLRLQPIRQLISERAWFAPAKGTAEQARDYCAKDEQFEEFGVLPLKKGTRTDLDRVHQMILDGEKMEGIVSEEFGTYVKYHRGIEKAYNFLKKRKRSYAEPEVIIHWGDTGTGKTRKVYDETFPDLPYRVPMSNGTQWYNGYDQDEVVVFDEFTPADMPITALLQMLDGYPGLQVPTKGGFCYWEPQKIYITSNVDPRDWYTGARPEHRRALMRRVSRIEHFAQIETGMK